MIAKLCIYTVEVSVDEDFWFSFCLLEHGDEEIQDENVDEEHMKG